MGAKDNSFQFMRVVFCSVWTAREPVLSLTPRDAWTGKYMKYVKLPLLASNFSNKYIFKYILFGIIVFL